MNIINWLDLHSGASQIILTIALVVTTIYYAVQSRKTVTLLGKQLNKPVVTVDHFHVPTEKNNEGTHCIHSKLDNIGNGVATSVLVEFHDYETNKLIGQSENLIDFIKVDGSQSSGHIHLKHADIKNLKYKEGHHGFAAELNCIIKFRDIYGRDFITKQMVFLVKETGMVVPEPGTFKQIF